LEIELNGEKLDFTLEKEQNITEVIEGIEQWLKESSLIITDLRIDYSTGEIDLYHELRRNWNVYSLDKIGKINISALSIQEVLVNSIYTVKEYLLLLQTAIRNADADTMDQLKSGYPYMIESIKQLFNNYSIVSIKNEITFYLEFFSSFDIASLDPANINENNKILTAAENLLKKLDNLLEVELYPAQSLLKITDALKKSAEEIKDVSIHLQTGKDKNAMDSIINFSDQMQQLLYLFQKLINTGNLDKSKENIAGQSIETFYHEFNAILKDLVEAFAVKDYVLIGDLLEYEVAPRLENVIEFIKKINVIREKNGI